MTIRILATSMAICFAGTVSAGTLTDTYTSFFAFGDSLSDDGKFGLPEPYFEGQFSSGPVWSEIIGGKFEDANRGYENLALGGATAGDVNRNSDGDPIPDAYPDYPGFLFPFATFNRQIDTFIANFDDSADYGQNPLISVLFGANDIFQQGGAAAKAAADAVADGIIRLSELGKQYNDFVVSNLPTVGSLPNVADFNDQLAIRLAAIDNSGINIIDVNQDAYLAELFPRLPGLGVTNFATPCLIPRVFDCTITGFDANGMPLLDANGEILRDLAVADTYYLIDGVHPSAVPQREFASFTTAALTADLLAPVPLPASLPLILAGFGALGALRLRNRRKAA